MNAAEPGGAARDRSAWPAACALVLSVCVVAANLGARPARGDERGPEDGEESVEHDSIGLAEINRLVAAGTIQPLARVLAAARTLCPGDLLDADLRRRGQRYIYEIEILHGGRREELYFDARTLALDHRS
jgi:hypothetical protein